jgi:effector-binding domain-containing protein
MPGQIERPRGDGDGEYRMNRISTFRAALVALLPLAAIALASPAPAQSPAASPAPAASAVPMPAPSATPVPAPVTPVPPPAETKSPADSPAASQTPAPAAPVQTADPFGEPFTLEPKKVVMLKGNANWDSAFDALIEAFKQLTAQLGKENVKASGNPMIVYTSTDDTGFTFIAEMPVDQDVKNLGKSMSMGNSPDGKALKFVHRGSYDNMDNTYEAITNHLDDKKLEAKDTFIEEYMTDPLKTAEDKLVINVYVPLK